MEEKWPEVSTDQIIKTATQLILSKLLEAEEFEQKWFHFLFKTSGSSELNDIEDCTNTKYNSKNSDLKRIQ